MFLNEATMFQKKSRLLGLIQTLELFKRCFLAVLVIT